MRLQTVRTLTLAVTADRSRTVLIKGRGLRPGRYLVTVTLTGTGGRSVPAQRLLTVRAAR